MACEKCTEGWVVTERGAKRCNCNQPVDRSAKPPVLTEDEAAFFVAQLAAVPYFPAEPGARLAIGDELRSMANSATEADWLVKRMRRLYERWPGPNEMRRVYVSRHAPRDGVMPIGISEAYPDGIPSERIEVPSLKALPPGHAVSADPKLERAIAEAAEIMKLPPARQIDTRFSKTLEAVLTAPQDRDPLPAPTPQVVTQADIERAVAELHAEKANA
jgi:hypothetical protein